MEKLMRINWKEEKCTSLQYINDRKLQKNEKNDDRNHGSDILSSFIYTAGS